MLKDRTDEASRFARFLRREAAGYHDPPEPPAEAMWAGIEMRLGAAPVPDSLETADVTCDAAGVGGAVDDPFDHPFDALGYHDPPLAPREAMWERIEAEWVARQPDAAGARKTTRGSLRLVVARTLGRRPGRTMVWLTGAAAASVALAVALDGGSQLPVPAEPEVVASTMAGPAAGSRRRLRPSRRRTPDPSRRRPPRRHWRFPSSRSPWRRTGSSRPPRRRRQPIRPRSGLRSGPKRTRRRASPRTNTTRRGYPVTWTGPRPCSSHSARISEATNRSAIWPGGRANSWSRHVRCSTHLSPRASSRGLCCRISNSCWCRSRASARTRRTSSANSPAKAWNGRGR